MKNINEIATATIGFLTLIGVAGGIATYFSEIKHVSDKTLISILVIYIVITYLFVDWVNGETK